MDTNTHGDLTNVSVLPFLVNINHGSLHRQGTSRCALAMQRAMVDVNEKWKDRNISQVAMRIGIHQGKAVVGNFGSKQRVDYTAIGPSVNLASRC